MSSGAEGGSVAGEAHSAAAPRSGGDRPRPARSIGALCLLGLLIALTIGSLAALGIWQLERRSWKLQLIDEITTAAHAAPIDAPGPSQWSRVAEGGYSYRRVHASGQYLNDRETLVQAVTRLGAGFWVLTPLDTGQGYTILVNRGFVPSDRRESTARKDGLIGGPTVVSGLLRASEPKGGFLHANDAAADRWYSRDVAAIAEARGLSPIAPYFIDADAMQSGGLPVGGLTVIDLPNNHLVYALTWFTLALMAAVAAGIAGRAEWRSLRRS